MLSSWNKNIIIIIIIITSTLKALKVDVNSGKSARCQLTNKGFKMLCM